MGPAVDRIGEVDRLCIFGRKIRTTIVEKEAAPGCALAGKQESEQGGRAVW